LSNIRSVRTINEMSLIHRVNPLLTININIKDDKSSSSVQPFLKLSNL